MALAKAMLHAGKERGRVGGGKVTEAKAAGGSKGPPEGRRAGQVPTGIWPYFSQPATRPLWDPCRGDQGLWFLLLPARSVARTP